MKSAVRLFFAAILFLALNASPLQAQEPDPAKCLKNAQGTPTYSPYVDQDFPDQVFFGDTHLHTVFSSDAGLFGNRLGLDEAYRFAKGEEITSSLGQRARLRRPLDFLVIADHAENLGLPVMIAEKNPDFVKTEFGKKSWPFSNPERHPRPIPFGVKNCLPLTIPLPMKKIWHKAFGKDAPPRLNNTMTPGNSLPSSVMSGHQCLPREVICTGM